MSWCRVLVSGIEPSGVGKPQLACVVYKNFCKLSSRASFYSVTELRPNPWPRSSGMDTSLQPSGSPPLPRRLEFENMSKSARTGDVQSDAHITSNAVVEASESAGAMSSLMASSVCGSVEDTGGSTGLMASFEEMFDLAPPAPRFTATDVEWVAHAKACASRVRFGHRTHIVWWGVGTQRVQRPLRRLAADTGVYAFRIPVSKCQRVLSYLDDPNHYSADGYLKMADTTWPGYSGYDLVHAKGGADKELQERLTVRVGNLDSVELLLSKEEMISDLVQEVREQLGAPALQQKKTSGFTQPDGKKLRAMHFLLQDGTMQASFALHSDANDLRGSIRGNLEDMTTAIVSLSSEKSAMRVWGMAPVMYDGQGSCVAFLGAALHESLPRAKNAPATSPVWKLAMFFC